MLVLGFCILWIVISWTQIWIFEPLEVTRLIFTIYFNPNQKPTVPTVYQGQF